MSYTVTLKHKDFGKVILENITEIHYCYPSPLGKRIAFESDIEGTGCTYPVEDVIEFEARLTQRAADEVPAWLCECGRKHLKVHYGFTCLCGAVLRR